MLTSTEKKILANLREQLRFHRLINAGCSKHPTYRANRRRTGACERCGEIWDAKQAIARMEVEEQRLTHKSARKTNNNGAPRKR